MKRVFWMLLVLVVIVGVIGWSFLVLVIFDLKIVVDLRSGDVVRGENIFWVVGCVFCYVVLEVKGDDKFCFGGGLCLEMLFGVFVVLNIL